jgi:tRNA U34 5-carboxymethylaminomethyl modifying GTPase MnmE/TrmE
VDSSEALSVERALNAMRRADVVVALVDASEGITQQVCVLQAASHTACVALVPVCRAYVVVALVDTSEGITQQACAAGCILQCELPLCLCRPLP